MKFILESVQRSYPVPNKKRLLTLLRENTISKRPGLLMAFTKKQFQGHVYNKSFTLKYLGKRGYDTGLIIKGNFRQNLEINYLDLELYLPKITILFITIYWIIFTTISILVISYRYYEFLAIVILFLVYSFYRHFYLYKKKQNKAILLIEEFIKSSQIN